jgi:hypothetical protein
MQVDRLKRREFITLVGIAAAWPLAARTQPERIRRIGVLSIGSDTTARHLVEAFFKGMADLGYQDGRNVQYDVRYGEGSFEKFEQYAREHVEAKVDLIWASGTPATTAAQKATTSIPVVFAVVGDPVYSKLVRSLALPGANLTGMSAMTSGVWRSLCPAERMAGARVIECRIHPVFGEQTGATRRSASKRVADDPLLHRVRRSRRCHRLRCRLCGKCPEQCGLCGQDFQRREACGSTGAATRNI